MLCNIGPVSNFEKKACNKGRYVMRPCCKISVCVCRCTRVCIYDEYVCVCVCLCNCVWECESLRQRDFIHIVSFTESQGVKSQCKSLSLLESARLTSRGVIPFLSVQASPHFLISSFTSSFLSNENPGTPKFKRRRLAAFLQSSVRMEPQIQFQIDCRL